MSFIIDLKDKVVLVTGVSSGIGYGTARAFAHAGAHVAGCARKPVDDPSAKEFCAAIESEGVKALYVQTDVTQPDELAALVESTIQTFGRLDVVVSNAGANVFEGAAGCNEEQWRHNLDLNLASHWRLAKYCSPIWRKRMKGPFC
jgi:NAD(P)-dependent dehydrogenase (short-subunit alcohol dehydrogenase family)